MPTLDSMRGELAFSSRIAAATLAVLAESGDLAARTRALRALGTQGAVVQGRGYWIRRDELAAMFRTAEVDARLARRIGRALVRPDTVGLALCYGGLATAEKAYRRVQHLLPRECASAEYESRQIDGERGRIRFHLADTKADDRLPDEIGKMMCAVRQGMLEAVPLLFGLVPATVREKRCSYAGGPHCEFEVKWSRGPRTGVAVGAGAGLVLGLGVLLGSSALGWPFWAAALAAPALVVVTGAAGRSVDLSRQLEAVAGARRGHLALLDQLDGALAERMDTLAKHGAIPQTHADVGGPVRRDESPTGLVPVERHRPRGHDDDEEPPSVGAPPDAVALRALVERHVEVVRGEYGDAPVGLELADTAPVRCHADLIGHVVEQLLRNALDATTGGVADAGTPSPFDGGHRVRVRLRETPDGVEIAVDHAGPGIDPEIVDRVFDPFAERGPTGPEGDLGLPACLRIVQSHGGELRIQTGGGPGSQVSFTLPAVGPR